VANDSISLELARGERVPGRRLRHVGAGKLHTDAQCA